VTYKPMTRLKLGPMSGMTVDPYWLTIKDVAADGEVTTADEDGMVDHIPAAIWAEEYEPRVQEVEGPDGNPDEPPMEEAAFPEPDEEEVEEIPFGFDDEPAPGYIARNMAQNAESLKLAGIDPRAVMHDPTDRMLTPIERLADMVNRKFNCESMARRCQKEADVLTGQIWKILTDAAKAQLMPTTSPAGVPDPLAAALGEAIDERALQQAPPPEPEPVEEIPTAQATAIAESVAAQVKEEAASADYEAVSRLEMNRALREVRGISDAQAARMAEKGIKSLAQFCQAVEERPQDWWSGMLYINKAKGDVIEQAVEDHWTRFKKKYGRA